MLYTTTRLDEGRKESDDVIHRFRSTLPKRHKGRQVDSQKIATLVEGLRLLEN